LPVDFGQVRAVQDWFEVVFWEHRGLSSLQPGCEYG
jgi:hypothetical protein